MTVTLALSDIKTDSHTRRSLSELSLSVAKCKKIVVVTGAGISCSSGIPDFRSSDGLYNLVKQKYPDVVLKGRDLFDASLFRDSTSTSVFFTFISQLKQSIDSSQPTSTHHFLKTLDTKKKLLRSYTQNIDGLEDRVGLSSSPDQEPSSKAKGKAKMSMRQCRNIQLHGDIHRVRCMACSANFPCTQMHLDSFDKGLSPECPECSQRSQARVARSARATRVGSLRPAIVLYDEPHPLGDEIGVVQGFDIGRKPDMLIIMGTSMKVHGLKKLVKEFAKVVHAQSSSASSSTSRQKNWVGKVIFVNKTPPGSEWSDIIDYHVSGETDEWSEKVVEDWKKMRPADWETQQTLISADGDVSTNGGSFKVVKDAVVPAGKPKAKDTKKKQLNPDENIPPPSFDMVLSTPEHPSLAKSKKKQPRSEGENIPPSNSFDMVLSTPGSPSKRRQGYSHYNDLESSPSKRRVKALGSAGDLEPEAKGLLFGKNNNRMAAQDVFDDVDELCADLSMQGVNSPKKPKPLKKSRSIRKTNVAKTIVPVKA
ncbi:DHS-like NAD/FAD-binding domain-containing protein [Dendrothele bispora CBS 962.96]|uniref:DHS-like NAD/FAD-binding domain-containing protein n=1 Tax=Dendrothele bispora (strain CBS 962.96) TaxID=1314807 RepID=A0A4S8MWP2_DENBC|nr:DHS-like NAD/FAD-binding domain-containing protein [Dendrothele bispora CBS 962.96]